MSELKTIMFQIMKEGGYTRGGTHYEKGAVIEVPMVKVDWLEQTGTGLRMLGTSAIPLSQRGKGAEDEPEVVEEGEPEEWFGSRT